MKCVSPLIYLDVQMEKLRLKTCWQKFNFRKSNTKRDDIQCWNKSKDMKYDNIWHKNRTFCLHHENMWNVSVRADLIMHCRLVLIWVEFVLNCVVNVIGKSCIGVLFDPTNVKKETRYCIFVDKSGFFLYLYMLKAIFYCSLIKKSVAKLIFL